MKRLPKAYSRAKRKEQVLLQFRIWQGNGDPDPKTMYRIARALGMTPNHRIHGLLQELVDEGKLTCEWRDQSGRYTTKFYLLADVELITEKFFKRRITVKQHGIEVGQLELAL